MARRRPRPASRPPAETIRTARNPAFPNLWTTCGVRGATSTFKKRKLGGGCVFCRAAISEPNTKNDEENLVVHRAHKNYIILNLYPYSTGHLMVVPYEHVDMLQFASQKPWKK